MLRYNKFILGILALGISTSIISYNTTIKANAYSYKIQTDSYNVELNEELPINEATDQNGVCWMYRELSDGNIDICYAKNVQAHMEFPSQLNGKTVTVIERARAKLKPDDRNLDTVIQSVIIPSTVKVVRGNFDSQNLADVQISSTTWVGENVFNNTPWFEKQRNSQGLVIINNRLLSAKNQSGDITIPSSVKEIGSNVFFEQNDITSVNIPDSVTIIGNSAFMNCTNLKKVNIGGSVKKIDDSAFYNCSNLGKINIPDSVTEIGRYSFAQCSNLKEVEISNTKANVGYCAFQGCGQLTDVKLPSTALINDNAFDGVPWIERQADSQGFVIENNVLIKAKNQSGDITIPSNVTQIGNSAFKDQDNITSVKIPSSVTIIGESAFAHCSNLKKVEIPNSVTQIGNAAFIECSNLEEANIPNSVKNKGVGVFDDCPKLNKAATSNTGNNTTQTATTNNTTQKSTVQQGWYKEGEHWNWLWSDGSKLTGWNEENGNWYYFYGNGQMATEFIDLGGYSYYFKINPSDGKAAMATGWQHIDGKWFYFNPNSDGYKGLMKRACWANIDGNWYYFYYDGQMAHNTYIGGYYVNSSGAWA